MNEQAKQLAWEQCRVNGVQRQTIHKVLTYCVRAGGEKAVEMILQEAFFAGCDAGYKAATVTDDDLFFGNELPQVIQRAAVKASEVPTGKLYDPTAFVYGEGEN